MCTRGPKSRSRHLFKSNIWGIVHLFKQLQLLNPFSSNNDWLALRVAATNTNKIVEMLAKNTDSFNKEIAG